MNSRLLIYKDISHIPGSFQTNAKTTFSFWLFLSYFLNIKS